MADYQQWPAPGSKTRTASSLSSCLSEQHYEHVGRRVQCLFKHAGQIIAASGTEMVFLDSDVKTVRRFRVPYAIAAMDALDTNTIVMCGEEHIAHLNLDSGTFSRILTTSNDADYCAIAALDRERFYFGTTKGRVGIMDLASGEEQGSVDVGFSL